MEVQVDEVLQGTGDHNVEMVEKAWELLVEMIRMHLWKSMLVIMRGCAPQLKVRLSMLLMGLNSGTLNSDVNGLMKWHLQ